MASLTLVHDTKDQAGVVSLAREIGARLEGTERDIPVIPLYICALLDEITWNGPAFEPEQSVHPIRAIAATFAWTFRQHLTDRETLIKQADEFNDLIRRIDDDDGWPVDRWLNGLVGCCIAMELGLQDPEHIRWPAEAGNTVAALCLRTDSYGTDEIPRRRSWVCERLLSARHAAAKLK